MWAFWIVIEEYDGLSLPLLSCALSVSVIEKPDRKKVVFVYDLQMGRSFGTLEFACLPYLMYFQNLIQCKIEFPLNCYSNNFWEAEYLISDGK